MVSIFLYESIFFLPYSDHFFVTYVITTILFGVQYAIISKYYWVPGSEYYIKTVTYGAIWIVTMFVMTYSTRRVLMRFFASQIEAEKTSNTLT